MLTARHRAIDRIRRDERLRGKLNLLGRELETAQHGAPAEFDDVLDEGTIDDDLLRLMFISCHPVLSTEARIALTLRLLGGLTTEEIARAFLAAEPTIAKRIIRAKQTLASRQVPFEVPSVAEGRGGWPRCSRCSTWCSTRDTRRWRGTTGCALRSAAKRCASAACSPD